MNPLLLLVVLLSAAGQLLVKAGADRTRRNPENTGGPGLLRRVLNPFLLAGVACVALVPLLYTRALAGTALSRAYAATGLSYPLVMMGSAFLLKERIRPRQYAGSLLILAGFLVWSGGR